MTTRVVHVSALAGVALALLAHGVGVAQPKPAMPRVGYLSPASSSDPRVAPFRQGLADLGWVEGRTIAIEYRWADERYERLPGLAAELIRLNVDVIVAWGPAIPAARQATSAIPIVMASTIDAVGSGFVASLAHPGGNVTGLTLTSSELMGKRLDLLKQCLPRLARVAMLTGPPGAGTAVLTKAAEDAARRLGLALEVREVRDGADIDLAFAAIARSRAGAVYVMESPVLHANRARILDLASARRLPIFGVRAFVEGGGLMSYGPDFHDLHRRAARFVDRILKGASPATLPVEQPTKFELVINMRTARALGLTIPPPVLLQADHVIE